MTIREAKENITAKLTPAVGQSEAKAMALAILEDVKGYTAVDVAIHGDRELLDDTVVRIAKIADRIAAGEPMQYAIGTARWMGMDFKVTPAVLIPRPETAQLVDRIVDDAAGKSDLRVLDVGTGSGCIAIALARALKFADVEAVDISPEALSVARTNAVDLGVKVRLRQADALKMPEAQDKYDIIVSNPPYIMEKEAAEMDARVKDHEPRMALFVPDGDPLLFYRAIADYAEKSLSSGGKLYFEINPLTARQLYDEVARRDFRNVELQRDFRGNYRFLIAERI